MNSEWHTPLIPALERQRQEDLCECEVTPVYGGPMVGYLRFFFTILMLCEYS